MFRLGKFSGRVYSEKQNLSEIYECCVTLPDNTSDSLINSFRIKNKLDCMLCMQIHSGDICPMQKGVVNGS